MAKFKAASESERQLINGIKIKIPNCLGIQCYFKFFNPIAKIMLKAMPSVPQHHTNDNDKRKKIRILTPTRARKINTRTFNERVKKNDKDKSIGKKQSEWQQMIYLSLLVSQSAALI